MTALEGELVSKAGLSAQEAKEISDQLREHYGLDKTIWVQFGKWFLGLLKGDLGYFFKFRKPVAEVIWTFLGWTFTSVDLLGGLLQLEALLQLGMARIVWSLLGNLWFRG